MHPVLRILGVFFAFCLTAVAWLVLGAVTDSRTSEQRFALDGRVSDLWGAAQAQQAPQLQLEWTDVVTEEEWTTVNGVRQLVTKRVAIPRSQVVQPAKTDLAVDLRLDERRKGLLWFPLYDVRFDGGWRYVHAGVPRDLRLTFVFPDAQGFYDDFRFTVDGVDRASPPENGRVSAVVPVVEGQVVELAVGYRSRGSTTWTYQPTQGVGQVDDFRLAMTTDFSRIDFPTMTMSPTSREQADGGWKLDWTFERLVTGYGVGMVMPERVQPGELAASMSLTAALPLGLFFLWIYVLGLLKGTEIHPINYLFVAAAFFAFNLLFAYTADHLPVEGAFVLASATSVFLVVSYLRLVVGPRFAFVEAGLAQLLYQVGFSAAHFFDGFTGLTITVLGVGTLFALMQLTGRVDWSRALGGRASPATPVAT
ncbi:MAG: inner membrane CreD family protein [Myxococcota bacterium]